MATQCPFCSKSNPPEAQYCHYDGRTLSQNGRAGPVQIGTVAFPMPFCFADGQSCANFNQLALACDDRWNEAKGLLANGTWPLFFTSIGRVDLVQAAKDALREPDPDVGLSQLLEKLPADALRRPELALVSAEENLGELTPGTDHRFELRISNRGMLVLRGMVVTDCDWLSLGDRSGASLRMFQARGIYTLTVHVLGSKLRAGSKPLQGDIVIDTNGGKLTFQVCADIPIRPFPTGTHANNVLAGAKSPRELAVMIKDHPQQAAVLFEQGAVKAWYASNGWTYPVDGTQATGKGAVQQFFEALGLTKPPTLEIDTKELHWTVKVGQRITRPVTISTQEPRTVYAQVWSSQSWIKPGSVESHGTRVTIPLQIEVPSRPGETIRADVTIQGNGKQQFVVPVSLEIVAAKPAAAANSKKTARKPPLAWILAGAGLLLVIAAGAAAFSMMGRNEAPVIPPVVAVPKPPPPTPKGAWWDGIPGTKLTSLVKELKRTVPQEQALFDGLAVMDDLDRREAYKKLADKVPELVRNQKAKDLLGKLLTECCIFEPFDPGLAPLRRALIEQIPQNDAAFQPEENGEEMERGLWSLQVSFAALSHKAIRPQRIRMLAGDLGDVMGPALDITAPLDKLQAQTEKLFAERCYRNTLPTASKSLDHALKMRGEVSTKCALLPGAFRDQVDADLFALCLSKGNDQWPKFESLLKQCLQSNDVAVGEKIVGCYEKANADLASKMEALMVVKWKDIANEQLTHQERVAALRTNLAAARVLPSDRLAQLQTVTNGALSAIKATEKRELALLQDTVPLAHASTLACILYHKEASVVQFDKLVAQVAQIKQPAGDDGKILAGKSPNAVGFDPTILGGGQLTKGESDPLRTDLVCSKFDCTLKAGRVYVISFQSSGKRAFLRVEDMNGRLEKDAGNGGGNLVNLEFTPLTAGAYRVIATGQPGANYVVRIQQGGIDLGKLESKKSNERIAAFTSLPPTFTEDLAPLQAKRVARYLLSIQDAAEIQAVAVKLKTFAQCRLLLLAVADHAVNNNFAQATVEAVVGDLLGQPLQFGKGDDWRLACRKLLLQRAVDLTESTLSGADQAAATLRLSYETQAKAFGMADDMSKLTRPTQVLEGLIKYIAAKAAQESPANKEQLDQIVGRELPVAQFIAENDLHHMVLLQRAWIKVQVIYLQARVPTQAKSMAKALQQLEERDPTAAGAVEQLRAGEETILKIWTLAHS